MQKKAASLLLLQGLDDGTIGGLGLDVTWHEPLNPNDPMFRHPNVVLTPHVAGVTELSYRNMGKRLAAEIRRVKQGLQPSVVINPDQGALSHRRPAIAEQS